MSKAPTSWADETDDLDESIHKQKEPQGNPWTRGNPFGITVSSKPSSEVKDNRDSEFPEPKNLSDRGREVKRVEGGSNERETRPFKGDEQHPPRDYQRGNYNRERSRDDDRSGRERSRDDDRSGREGYSGENRGNGYERENRSGYGREDRGGRNYDDRRGGYRDRSRNDKPREPVPFPTEPPFTAYVGNLSFNVVEDDLYSFFGDECKVNNVRLLSNRETNKPKGFGYVEFGDLDSLKHAVAKNGEPLLDRPLRIDVAEAKPEEKQQSGGWNRSFDRPAKSFSQSSYPTDAPFSRNREEPEQPTKERPKLDLKPRSSISPKPKDEPDTVYAVSKSNPFGMARPRDENLFVKKKEEPVSADTSKSPEAVKPYTPAESSEKQVEQADNKGDFPRRDPQRRDPQRRDDKSRRPPRTDGERSDKGDMNKPFVRGSSRPTKPFRKDEKNGREEKPRPREERKERDKVPEQLKQLPDVRSANLFSALGEEQE